MVGEVQTGKPNEAIGGQLMQLIEVVFDEPRLRNLAGLFGRDRVFSPATSLLKFVKTLV